MKDTVSLRLRAKQNLGIAGVAAEVGRHFRGGLEQIREEAFVNLDNGIAGIEHV